MSRVIAAKDRIIKKLQADIERYQVGVNDVNSSISQLKVEKLSVELIVRKRRC